MDIEVQKNLNLLKLNVTAAFLNGVLQEVVYMEQSEGFVKKGKENYVKTILVKSVILMQIVVGIIMTLSQPVDICSRAKTCIALSTAEAECMALASAAQEVVWMRELIYDLTGQQSDSTLSFCR